MSRRKSNYDTDVSVLDKPETQTPKMFKVIILNDDYTPMDFVVHILMSIFGHNERSAEKIMLDIHKKGAGLAGVYSFEVAETKSYVSNKTAKENKYPLKSYIEEE